jgi:hypothetical protein
VKGGAAVKGGEERRGNAKQRVFKFTRLLLCLFLRVRVCGLFHATDGGQQRSGSGSGGGAATTDGRRRGEESRQAE